MINFGCEISYNNLITYIYLYITFFNCHATFTKSTDYQDDIIKILCQIPLEGMYYFHSLETKQNAVLSSAIEHAIYRKLGGGGE